MKNRFRLIRRGNRKASFYAFDRLTKTRTSLVTGDRTTAEALVAEKNESCRVPEMNFHIARVYLSASDTGAANRTWQTVMDEMSKTKTGENHVLTHAITVFEAVVERRNRRREAAR